MTSPIPDEFGTLIFQLVVADAVAATDFYQVVFGAKELYCQHAATDARVVHAELLVGRARFIVYDAFPERGLVAPPALGGTPVTLMLYVEDVDRVFAGAVAAGASAESSPEDHFWGVRSGVIVDPFGHRWLLASRIDDLSPAEILTRAQAAAPAERVPLGRR